MRWNQRICVPGFPVLSVQHIRTDDLLFAIGKGEKHEAPTSRKDHQANYEDH